MIKKLLKLKFLLFLLIALNTYFNIAGAQEKTRIIAENNNTYEDDPILNLSFKIGDNLYGKSLLFYTSDGYSQCSTALEENKFCIEKEECSELLRECVENESLLAITDESSSDYRSMINIRINCNTNLLSKCNTKWGISNDVVSDISDFIGQFSDETDLIPSSAADNAYGWFNEVCFVKGFIAPRRVIAYKSLNGSIKGRCLIDTIISSEYEDCSSGGNAKNNCYCFNAENYSIQDLGLNSNIHEIRYETAREAGLCIDMPRPKICPSISYGTNFSNPDDLYFIGEEYGLNSNSLSEIHQSHKDRSNNIQYGNSDFAAIFSGVDDFTGSCNGFWKYQKDADDLNLKPILNCSNNGVWNNLRNNCIRYSCSEIYTNGISKVFQNGYHVENNWGFYDALGNGYANWPANTQSSDLAELVYANSEEPCIPGFELSNNNLPSRYCNQLGQWQYNTIANQNNITNQCVRIGCSAIDPVTDGSSWADSGGARFEEALASMSKTEILSNKIVEHDGHDNHDSSISYGSCNEDLGYYSSPNGFKPTRGCNYLGEWERVQNPCVTTCEEVSEYDAANHKQSGFAYWSGVASVTVAGAVYGDFQGCVDNYVKSPYSSNTTDENGNYLNENIFNNDDNGNIIKTTPTRRCVSLGSVDDNQNVTVWEDTRDICISGCPGASEDSRINVGVTQHQTSNGIVNISWNKTSFGNWSTYSSSNDMSSSDFEEGNSSNYIVRRYCGLDGKWEEPVATCLASGNFKNGFYGNDPISSSDNDALLSAGNLNSYFDEISTGLCDSQAEPPYYNDVETSSPPEVECLFRNDNKNIDEVYLSFANGSKDCQEANCEINEGDVFDIATYYGESGKFNSVIGLEYKGVTTVLVTGQSVNLSNTVNPDSYTDTNSGNAKVTCREDGRFDKINNRYYAKCTSSSRLYSSSGYANNSLKNYYEPNNNSPYLKSVRSSGTCDDRSATSYAVHYKKGTLFSLNWFMRLSQPSDVMDHLEIYRRKLYGEISFPWNCSNPNYCHTFQYICKNGTIAVRSYNSLQGGYCHD